MSDTNEKKSLRSYFTEPELEAFKTKRIAELTEEALELISNAAYVESRLEELSHMTRVEQGLLQPLEEELGKIYQIASPDKATRARRKELEGQAAPHRAALKTIGKAYVEGRENAQNLRQQAGERLFRRDVIRDKFPALLDDAPADLEGDAVAPSHARTPEENETIPSETGDAPTTHHSSETAAAADTVEAAPEAETPPATPAAE